jgi:signal transduction histidine kinase
MLLGIIADRVDAIRADTRLHLVGSIEKEFHVLNDAIDSAFAATREFLTLDRRQIPNPPVIDVNDVITRSHGLLRQVLGSEHLLLLELRAEDAAVRAQDIDIEWLLLHLVANARDAMPGGGMLRIETESTVREAARAVNAGLEPHLRMTVTDTGRGVDPAVRDTLFEPFVTTRSGNVGFGLTAVATTVRRLKGSIRILIEEGGTRVDVYLPLTGPDAA